MKTLRSRIGEQQQCRSPGMPMLPVRKLMMCPTLRTPTPSHTRRPLWVSLSAAAASLPLPNSAGAKNGTPVAGINNSLESGTLMLPKNAAAQGSTKQLWGNSSHVTNISVPQAEKLYLGLTERTNTSDTLLIVYAPWCSHCRSVEKEVAKLASGLAHVKDLQVAALNADSVEGRYFARDVLGAQVFPTFITFPKGSRTFYTYQGKTRDAASLTRFLNMTCKQQDEQQLELGGVAKTAHVPEVAVLATPTSSSSSAFSSLLPALSTYGPLAAVLLGITLAATLVTFLMRSLLPSKATAGTSGSSAASALAADVAVPKGLASEIDSSIGRTMMLSLRLIQARLGLLQAAFLSLFGGGKDAFDARIASGRSASTTGKASATNATAVSPAAAAAIAAEVASAAKAMAALEARSAGAAAVSATGRPASAGGAGPLPRSQAPSTSPATPPMRPLSASASSTPTSAALLSAKPSGSASKSEGTAVLQNLSADDLLAMLASEGSVGKVVDKLMKKPAGAQR